MALTSIPIRGAEVFLFKDNKFIGGQRSCSFDIQADSIDVSTKDNDGWKSTIAGMRSWSFSLESISLAGQGGASQVEIDKACAKGDILTVKMVEPGKKMVTGAVTVTSLGGSYGYGDAATISATFSGMGKPQTVYAPFIQSVSQSGTTITVTLTEAAATTVSGATLASNITVGGAAPSSATITGGVITITTATAAQAGDEIVIKADTLKNGELKQNYDLSWSIE